MSDKEINFAKLSQELDDIIVQLQSDDVEIDKAVELHDRGAKLVKELENYLKTTENKVNKVIGK